MTPAVTFLGPQRRPTLERVLPILGVDGTVAAINAGWQEREADDGELLSLLGGRGVNLQLHARWMSVLQEDPEYAGAEREHFVVLDELQQLYRIGLGHAVSAAQEIAGRVDGHPRTQASAFEDAVAALRRIDETHLERVRDLWQTFRDAWPPQDREAIVKHRHAVHDVLAGSECLCITGGHVGDLLHVLRLFDVVATLPGHVVAWSAGAMALTDRVVLFHDRAAQGPAPAEVLDNGLGLVSDLVALPHARRRLRADDSLTLSIFAQRFAPARCLVLDDGVTIDVGASRELPKDARIITSDGRITSVGEA